MTWMTSALPSYDRIALRQPDHLPQEQWAAIAAEAARVEAALDRQDAPQAIGSLKDLLESIARCVKEIGGEPELVGSDFSRVVQGAHEILRSQRGHELAHSTRHAQQAQSALTMAKRLAETRNELGTGHGRAAVPVVVEDELFLTIDASLTWARWAIRRLGLFCIGRPAQIVQDLQTEVWRRGELSRRLAAADLSDPQVGRQVGLAVGRRAASGTFTVLEDGIEGPAESDDLTRWPGAFRWAAATGLLFDAAGASTVTAWRLALAIDLVRPVLEEQGDNWEAQWQELVDRIDMTSGPLVAPGDQGGPELRLALQTLIDRAPSARDGASLLVGKWGL